MSKYKIEQLQAETSDEHECDPMVIILKVISSIPSDYWGNELSISMEEAVKTWIDEKEKPDVRGLPASEYASISLMRRLNSVYYVAVVIV